MRHAPIARVLIPQAPPQPPVRLRPGLPQEQPQVPRPGKPPRCSMSHDPERAPAGRDVAMETRPRWSMDKPRGVRAIRHQKMNPGKRIYALARRGSEARQRRPGVARDPRWKRAAGSRHRRPGRRRGNGTRKTAGRSGSGSGTGQSFGPRHQGWMVRARRPAHRFSRPEARGRRPARSGPGSKLTWRRRHARSLNRRGSRAVPPFGAKARPLVPRRAAGLRCLEWSSARRPADRSCPSVITPPADA